MARKRSKKLILRKKSRRTRHRRRYKGGKGDEKNDSLAHINRIFSKKYAEDKKMLETAFDANPPLSGVLKIECKNPDNCLALGQYGYAVKKYFNKFNDLTLIDNTGLKTLGADSVNGFVLEVPFVKGGYRAYCALKCSADELADNLYYEYFVGTHFINRHIKKIPCFVETFGCYNFKSVKEWYLLQKAAKVKKFEQVDLQKMIEPFINTGETPKELFSKSCKKNKLICVFIQHFDNARTFRYEYNKNFDNVKFELYNLLYQVYFGLTQLGYTYTHYDLHADNVLLYKPYDGNQYITMRYHSKGQIYEFNTEYVCKIIDYGRNYIKLPNGVDTDNLLTGEEVGICNLPDCHTKCGEYAGYGTIQGTLSESYTDEFGITPNIPNMSHDLRLAYLIPLKGLEINYKQQKNSRKNLTPGIDNHINNIFDMRTALERIMESTTNPSFNADNQKKKYDASWKQAAIMEIYDDGQDYTYIPI